MRAVGTREGCYLLQFFKLYNLEKFLQKHHFDGFSLPNGLPFLLNHSFLEEHLVGFTYYIHNGVLDMLALETLMMSIGCLPELELLG